MILRRLSEAEYIKGGEDIPHFFDHCLYVQEFTADFNNPKIRTGLGLLSVLEGKVKCIINDEHLQLDNQAFVLLNKGSELSIEGRIPGTFVILYFNNLLSEIITESLFQGSPKLERRVHDYHDYSLVEHVHYKNASLKDFLPLLIELGASCASFYALKADMLIRTILDSVIQENYSAIQISSNLEVVKNSTRVSLYKRLSITKAWIEQNYSSAITVQQMAEMAMLNQHHFLRIFKKTYGQTPHRYLTGIRIARAQTLLWESSQPVSSVCNAVGFDSLSSFSHLFKAKTGLSPSQYREAKPNGQV